ncbi:MAG: alpha/beta hydrolase [Lachnospiraceae bacterium]|nr:alpha/beta hydrolase [Lachnospiraceae bacterium]
MEQAGRLVAPKGDTLVNSFDVEGIECEEITPEFAHNPNYAVLYAHGGGYITGSTNYARILAAKLALSTGFTTYSFNYRLAPEHPYPAALNDALTVWNRVSKKFPPDRIFIAGDSAGGNLALCLVQKLLEEGCELPKGMLLFSPWTDMTATASSYETYKDVDPVLTKEYIQGAAKAYMGEDNTPGAPVYSPLFGTLKGLPPAFIMTGRNEILLDDSVRLRDGIVKEGGRAVLDIEEGGWHVYQQMPLPMATQAMKRLASYITEEIRETKLSKDQI